MKGAPGVGRLVRCDDRHDVAARAAAALYIDLCSAARAGLRFRWLSAGGPEAQATFDMLRERHLDAPWRAATIAMGDERCVPHTSDESNWGQLERRLLAHLDDEQPELLATPGDADPGEAAATYDRALAEAFGAAPEFDHAWLGVGANGHTLSLFPGRPVAADRRVMPVADAPDPPPSRISLTLDAIAHTRHCLILATGADKRDAVTRALRDDASLPIAQAVRVIEQGGGAVTWIVDEAACPSE